MSKRPIIAPRSIEADCTGLGRWLGWLIVAIVLGAFIAMATKSHGQGLLSGAAGGAAGPPRTIKVDAAVAPGSPCDDDITVIPTLAQIQASGFIVAQAHANWLDASSVVGTAGGAGTVASPMTMKVVADYAIAALTGASATKHHIYLRGGTYTNKNLDMKLRGTLASPWIIEPYPGETVIFNMRSDLHTEGPGVGGELMEFVAGSAGIS